jgi:hypothetical protein
MDERPRLPHYDPDYCRLIAKWSASICVGLLAIELLVILIVEPSSRCPGWTIYAENGSAMPSWILAGIFTGGPTIWICYIVLRWKQKSQEIYDSIAYGRPKPPFSFLYTKHEPHSKELNFENIFLLNFNWLFLVINIGWCGFCAIPLWMSLVSARTY